MSRKKSDLRFWHVVARGLLAQPHLVERFFRGGLELGEAVALDVAVAGLFQIRQLLDVLLEPERAFQCPEKIVELDAQAAGVAGERRNRVKRPSTRASWPATRAAVS